MEMEGMKKYVSQILKRIPGLYAIAVTDRDGVPLLRVSKEGSPELALRATFLATFGMATDQASKMGLSNNKSMICIYSSYQVVHFNKMPLMVSLIASHTTNTGLLLGVETELEDLLQDLKMAVAES